MKKLLFAILMFTAFNGVCQTKIENQTEYRSVSLKEGDAQFLAFKDSAQKYMPRFINSLVKNSSGYVYVVKSDFVENGTHEHMWSRVVVFSNGGFKGTFIDSPFQLKNIKTGDKVTINKKDVEDWSIYDLKDKKIDGGFSDKYLASKK